MSKLTTEQKNEVIAVFMGGVKQIIPEGGLHGYKEGTVLWCFLFSDIPDPLTYLEYHSDWSWLMPVWHRFVDLKFTTPKQQFEHSELKEIIGRSILYNIIERAFDNLFEGVQWYNQQKEHNHE